MFDLEKYQFKEAAATAIALGGLAMSGYQAYQGAQNAKKANRAINEYNRQDLDKSNPYENMQISTIGSDVMNEQNQINSANAIEAMRAGGSRGIAMLPSVTAQNNQANQNTRAYLDDQVTKRNYAIAGDKTAIRGMKEDRENADLAGLGQQLQTGRQDMWSGARGMFASGMYGAENGAFNNTPQVEGIESYLNPAGVVTPNYTNSPTSTAPRFSTIARGFSSEYSDSLIPKAPTLSSMLRGFNKI